MKRLIPTLTTGLVPTLVAALLVGLSGCQTTTTEPAPPPPPPTPDSEFQDAGATEAPAPEAPAPEPPPVVTISIDPVYFDFDKSDIRPDAAATLRAAAAELSDSAARIVISGHCDSRGSEEYNLALGERRAATVRRHLANLGVSMDQITIVSYGELRPAAQGSGEAVWSLNRRAEFEQAD